MSSTFNALLARSPEQFELMQLGDQLSAQRREQLEIALAEQAQREAALAEQREANRRQLDEQQRLRELMELDLALKVQAQERERLTAEATRLLSKLLSDGDQLLAKLNKLPTRHLRALHAELFLEQLDSGILDRVTQMEALRAFHNLHAQLTEIRSQGNPQLLATVRRMDQTVQLIESLVRAARMMRQLARVNPEIIRVGNPAALEKLAGEWRKCGDMARAAKLEQRATTAREWRASRQEEDPWVLIAALGNEVDALPAEFRSETAPEWEARARALKHNLEVAVEEVWGKPQALEVEVPSPSSVAEPRNFEELSRMVKGEMADLEAELEAASRLQAEEEERRRREKALRQEAEKKDAADFLAAKAAALAAEEAVAAKKRRRLRTVAAGTVVLALVGLGGYAYGNWQRAREQQRLVKAKEAEEQAVRAAAAKAELARRSQIEAEQRAAAEQEQLERRAAAEQEQLERRRQAEVDNRARMEREETQKQAAREDTKRREAAERAWASFRRDVPQIVEAYSIYRLAVLTNQKAELSSAAISMAVQKILHELDRAGYGESSGVTNPTAAILRALGLSTEKLKVSTAYRQFLTARFHRGTEEAIARGLMDLKGDAGPMVLPAGFLSGQVERAPELWLSMKQYGLDHYSAVGAAAGAEAIKTLLPAEFERLKAPGRAPLTRAELLDALLKRLRREASVRAWENSAMASVPLEKIVNDYTEKRGF